MANVHLYGGPMSGRVVDVGRNFPYEFRVAYCPPIDIFTELVMPISTVVEYLTYVRVVNRGPFHFGHYRYVHDALAVLAFR